MGAITAAAITTFAPPMETFSKGRDFAAWVGLTPRQHSSVGKDRLGRTLRMGQEDIRRMLVAVALANRMARTAWAFAIRFGPMAPDGSLRKGEDTRDPATAAA